MRSMNEVKYGNLMWMIFFFFQAEDGIRDLTVTGVQTCALPISRLRRGHESLRARRWDAHREALGVDGVADRIDADKWRGLPARELLERTDRVGEDGRRGEVGRKRPRRVAHTRAELGDEEDSDGDRGHPPERDPGARLRDGTGVGAGHVQLLQDRRRAPADAPPPQHAEGRQRLPRHHPRAREPRPVYPGARS